MSALHNSDVVQANLRVSRGEEGLWRKIREIDVDGPWTLRDVVARTHTDKRFAGQYIEILLRGGYARIVDTIPTRRGPLDRYRLTKRPGDAPRLAADGSELPEPDIERLWRAMKMAKTFSVAELADACPESGLPVIARYIGWLLRAGVLHIARKGTRGVCPAQYRLIRDLGPRAPRILSAKVVFDPNGKTVLGKSDAREVSP
jgi:hypothetical protein